MEKLGLPITISQYRSLTSYLAKLSPCQQAETIRSLGKNDLFFLLVYVLNRPDALNQWILDRTREYQADPWWYLDLWARGHYKSTIITFAHIIFEIIRNSELTHGLFSFSQKISRPFLTQIKREAENNKKLPLLYPEVFFNDPEKESPLWTDSALIFKRKGNPKEATIEAWGVVKNQPTSKHFDRLHYDDLVTPDSVTTPEQIMKTTDLFRMSLNLGSKEKQVSMAGTFYAHNDTYNTLIKERVIKPRIHKALRIDGDFSSGVLKSKEELVKERQNMGAAVFATQMMLDPSLANNKAFKVEWLKYWGRRDWSGMNIYIIVDPASSKAKRSDYTVMLVIGLNRDKNYYLIDGVRDRLNLGERTNKLFRLVEKYDPLNVYYEQYGQQADKEHIELEMENRNFRFNISTVGGQIPKEQRILRLQPDLEKGRIFIPTELNFFGFDGTIKNLTQEFIDDEYRNFPAVSHDDILDCLARIYDIDGAFPSESETYQTDYYNKDE